MNAVIAVAIYFIFLMIPTGAYAGVEGRKLVGLFELSRSHRDTLFGLHLGVPLGENFLYRFGISLFNNEDKNYMGAETALRAYLGRAEWKPFLEGGAFLGDTKICSDVGPDQNPCERKKLAIGYAAVGLQFKNIGLFYRNYKIHHHDASLPPRDAIGITVKVP